MLWTTASGIPATFASVAYEVDTQHSMLSPGKLELGVGVGASDTSRGIRCVLEGLPPSGLRYALRDASGGVLAMQAVAQEESKLRIRIELRRIDGLAEVRCVFAPHPPVPTPEVILTASGVSAAGALPGALIADTVHAAFEYVTLYELGP